MDTEEIYEAEGEGGDGSINFTGSRGRCFYPFRDDFLCPVVECSARSTYHRGRQKNATTLTDHMATVHNSELYCGFCKTRSFSAPRAVAAHQKKCMRDNVEAAREYREHLHDEEVSEVQEEGIPGSKARWLRGELERLASLESGAPTSARFKMNRYLADLTPNRTEEAIKSVRKRPVYCDLLSSYKSGARPSNEDSSQIPEVEEPAFRRRRRSVPNRTTRELSMAETEELARATEIPDGWDPGGESDQRIEPSENVEQLTRVERGLANADPSIGTDPRAPSTDGDGSNAIADELGEAGRRAPSDDSSEQLIQELIKAGLSRHLAVELTVGRADFRLIVRIFGHLKIEPIQKRTRRAVTNTRGGQTEGVSLRAREKRTVERRSRFQSHQELFRKSLKSLMEQLRKELISRQTGDNESAVTYERVKTTYADLMSARPEVGESLFSNPYGDIPKVSRDITVSPISEAEVDAAMLGCKPKSAVGPDGYSFEALKRVKPFILATVFNKWLVEGRIPDELRVSRTVLIPKKDAPKEPGDFRPLTIGPALLRLYTKILYVRMSEICKPHALQAGFCLDKSCSSNILPLQSLISHRRKSCKPFYAVFLDLSKAFDTVPHERILGAMRQRRFPEAYVRVVQDLYTDCQTVFHLDGFTDGKSVPCRRGVKQGDPLSPYLFSLVVDPLLYWCNNHQAAAKIPRRTGELEQRNHGAKIGAMAFADDLVVVAESNQEAQILINMATEFLSDQGLRVNPSKTQLFAWGYNAHKKQFAMAQPIKVNDTVVKPVMEGEGVRYLGMQFTYSRPPVLDVRALRADLEAVRRARLRPFQKKVLIQSVVLPRFLYATANTTRVKREGRRADDIVKRAIKAILHLPHSFPDHLLYMKSQEGGLGILNLEHTAMRVQAKAIARIRRSSDPNLLALLDLRIMAEHVETLARELGIPDTLTDAKALNAALNNSRKAWEEARVSKYENKELFLFRKDKHSNSFLNTRKRYFRDRDRIDALRLRSNLCRNRAVINRAAADPNARRCRKCNLGEETSAHILQICTAVKDQRTKRHDYIRDRVFEMVRRRNGLGSATTDTTIEKECTFTHKGRTDRPDIIFKTGKQAWVIDPVITWDTNASMNRAYERKIESYGFLHDHPSFEGYDFKVLPVVFGARGATHPKTIAGLQKLKLKVCDLDFLTSRALLGSVILINRFTRQLGG